MNIMLIYTYKKLKEALELKKKVQWKTLKVLSCTNKESRQEIVCSVLEANYLS